MVTIERKKIVILGAGFAGLKVTQELQKKLCHKDYDIILVDKNNTHLFRADLYEVATAFNEEITEECLLILKNTIATPISDLINETRVTFLHDCVEKINAKKKEIQLKNNGKLDYEFLVVALGSVTNFFNVPGLEENSLPLKTIQDGLRINCHLDQFFLDLWKKKEKKDIYISIGGGGATGVEVAAELANSVKKLCKKYKYPKSKIHIQIIEAGSTLAALDKKGTELILERFKEKKIEVYLNHRIIKVSKNKIDIQNLQGEKIKLDSQLNIWTGGVKVNPIVADSIGEVSKRGAIYVNEFLQSKDYKKVYAAGDNAYFEDPDEPSKRLPMLASYANQQGKVIAHNILKEIYGGQRKIYKPKGELYILPIGGKFAIWKIGHKILSGTWVWMVRRLWTLKYDLSILPFFKAIRKWQHGSKIFVKND